MLKFHVALLLVGVALTAAQGPGFGRKPAPPPFHKLYSGCQKDNQKEVAGSVHPPFPVGNMIATQIFMSIVREKNPIQSDQRPTNEEIKAKIDEGCKAYLDKITAFITSVFDAPAQQLCNLVCLCGEVAGQIPSNCGSSYNPRPF